ncbi:hypothetical protein PCANC_16300 [Puccinia coronata f. sp. avenae]|uniref:Uncharacterized protein n=1 Tax=Puccinia coronata f. sp. avenae TaxID=200324 RepID=A0A2N5UH31_9BASI|nr:hypothetical protein PCANC_16300 [Puccinia coronata f. sp. avenae]
MSHLSLNQSHVASSGFNDLAASIDALPLDVVKIFLALAVSSLAALALLAINTAAQKAKPTSWIWLTRPLDWRLEQKRAEHELQRAEQKRAFAVQMRALEAQHESKAQELLGAAASAPTTPPPYDSEVDHILPERSRGWQEPDYRQRQ